MLIRVLFFGVLKDLAGKASDTIELPNGASVAALLEKYRAHIPKLEGVLASIAIAVNQQYAGTDTKLNADDEVALLPPVSGGAEEQSEAVTCSIVHEPINTHEVMCGIRHPEDGSVLAFEGIVRNQTRGRKTLYLDYEAYEPMALQELRVLAEQSLKQFAVREVALVHRLGRLEIGETSVLIVVASAHRAAAFEACRWLIDTLKRTVPIWKKEYFEDGAVWADGEPFPPEIPRAISGA